MSGSKCFYIEGKYLYLEQTLVEYNGIPIYFLCRSDKRYYTVLCIDIDELMYVVVRTAASDVYSLLHGRIPMRNVILKEDHYWQVISAEDMLQDDVRYLAMDELDHSLLPEAGACFEVLSDEVRTFVEKFDSEFLNSETFSRVSEEILRVFDTTIEPYCKNIDAFEYIANYMLKLRTAASVSLPVSGNYELQEKRMGNLRRGSETEDWTIDEMTQIAA